MDAAPDLAVDGGVDQPGGRHLRRDQQQRGDGPLLQTVQLDGGGQRHDMLAGEGARRDEGGEKYGEHHDTRIKHHVRDVGPQQVEHGHLDRDQEHRVDCFLHCRAHAADLEYAVLRHDLHGDVGLGAVGQQIEQRGQVDEDAEHEVDDPRAAVKNDPPNPETSVQEEANVSFEQRPNLLHDGGEGAHVVLGECLDGGHVEDVGGAVELTEQLPEVVTHPHLGDAPRNVPLVRDPVLITPVPQV